MPKFAFQNAHILGLSVIVPQQEFNLLDDKNLYDGDMTKLNRVINSSGFLKRRIAPKDVMTSDLCEQAARDLIQNVGCDINTIDGLLFVSYTPDYLMPATAYVLHQKLGLSTDCVVMDIPQACSGYVIGLAQASMLINSGCKKILLLVGDCFSKFSDMFNNHTAPVFGDAGSATLIEYDEGAKTSFYCINSDGKGYDSLMCKNGGFRNLPRPTSFYEDGGFRYESNMDGGRIFEFVMREITPHIQETMRFAGVQTGDVDTFVFHQANKFILQNIARQLGIDEDRVPMKTLSKYGNQCGASIPCAIADVLCEQVKEQENTLVLSGFGVGLSWASAVVHLDKVYCSMVGEYQEKL